MANATQRTGVGFTFQTPTVAQSSFSAYLAPGLYTHPMTSTSCFNSRTSSSGLIQFPSPEVYKMSTNSIMSYTTNSGAYNNEAPIPPVGMAASSWQPTVPGNMPWGISPLTTANLMRFTGSPTMPSMQTLTSSSNGLNQSPLCSVIRPSASEFYPNIHKRKVDRVENETVPSKVFINEERMAARMQEMHLDNNNLEWHPNLEEDSSWYHTHQQQRQMAPSSAHSAARSGSPPLQDEEMNPTFTKSDLPRLQLAKELKLDIKTKEILPKVILDEISRPQMQVVLWQPQPDFIRNLVPHRCLDGATALSCRTDDPQSDDEGSIDTQADLDPDSQLKSLSKNSFSSVHNWNTASDTTLAASSNNIKTENCIDLDLNFDFNDDDDDMEL